MNIWFTSDRHFDHKNIIRFCGRPFINKEFFQEGVRWDKQDKRFWDHEAMNEFMIEENNRLVKPEDWVFDLGDFSFGRDSSTIRAMQYLRRLNGKLHFLWGNHDAHMKEIATLHPYLFAWVSKDFLTSDGSPSYEFHHKGVNLVLHHYPMEAWHGSHKGAGHLYGHCHGTHPERDLLRFDVGVDSWDFRPVHLDEVLAKLKAKADGKDPRTLPGVFKPQYNFNDK